MQAVRAGALALVLVVAVAVSWWFFGQRSQPNATIAVYYTKLDGTTVVPWNVSLGPARDPQSVAFYAAVQTVAGPPAGVEAVRFPAATRVLSTAIDGSTAIVDLSSDVGAKVEGSFSEAAEFKALVYSLTALPGIDAVRVQIGGVTVATLPGGHLELDEPLSRQSF